MSNPAVTPRPLTRHRPSHSGRWPPWGACWVYLRKEARDGPWRTPAAVGRAAPTEVRAICAACWRCMIAQCGDVHPHPGPLHVVGQCDFSAGTPGHHSRLGDGRAAHAGDRLTATGQRVMAQRMQSVQRFSPRWALSCPESDVEAIDLESLLPAAPPHLASTSLSLSAVVFHRRRASKRVGGRPNSERPPPPAPLPLYLCS